MEKELTSQDLLDTQTAVLPYETYDTPDWDVERMVSQVLDDLHGQVSETAVEEVVLQILPKFENARVKNFVPIFVRREAVQELKKSLKNKDNSKAQ
jgi:hypothetical protein